MGILMNDLPFTIAPEAAAYIEQTLVWAYKEKPGTLDASGFSRFFVQFK